MVEMPSKHTLNVSLTGHLCDFVSLQVSSGRFGTSSEVVRAALRLLERDVTPSASFDGRTGTKADTPQQPPRALETPDPSERKISQ
jgi:Arc/MetJ-type ribon-helix-helix transcriptional regulator